MATEEDIQTLKSYIQELECRTGKKYQLTLNEEGQYRDKGIIINSFENRDKYLVYDMRAEYKDLEGTYDNYEDIVKKIELFKLNFALEIKKNDNGGYIWKCPTCKEWGRNDGQPNNEEKGDDMKNDKWSYNHQWNGCCQNCDFSSKWSSEDIHISLYTDSIYTAGGGSISICHDIGKIKIV